MSDEIPESIEILLPSNLELLFWDCDFSELNWNQHNSYIIHRILDRGNWDTIQWLRKSVGDSTIKDWFLNTNGGGLDPRKLRFWAVILELPKKLVDDWVEKARNSVWGRRCG